MVSVKSSRSSGGKVAHKKTASNGDAENLCNSGECNGCVENKSTTVRGRKSAKAKTKPELSNRLITEYFPRTKRVSPKDLAVLQDKRIRHYISNDIDPTGYMEVQEINCKGKGIVALSTITKGSFICEYAGDLIDLIEAEEREKDYQLRDVGCYMYYFIWDNKQWCVDATRPSEKMGRLINHSRKQPNCKTKIFVHENKPHLVFIALRDINPGEEILYDYGETDRTAIKHHPWLSRS